MIVLSPEIASDMVTHARGQSPIEACGLLAGKDGVVKCAYRLTNCDASPEHFSLDPKEQFAVAKDMRTAGLELLAVYHSHPASPARMSDEDLRLALAPGMRYVIVSLVNNEPEIKSFTIRDGVAVEEPVMIRESIE
jgi:[CysO sulfur-carrier protein]-S-L-cysteine hydrolase